MRCKVCREFKKNSLMVSGCTNFHKSTLTRHLESTEHKQATQEKLLRHNFQQSYEQALTTNNEAILTAMKTVYFLVKTLTPTSQYSEHIEFLKFLGMYFWKSNYCSYWFKLLFFNIWCLLFKNLFFKWHLSRACRKQLTITCPFACHAQILIFIILEFEALSSLSTRTAEEFIE